MNYPKLAFIALCLVTPLVLGFSYLSEFLAVDRALDSGASYNYTTGEADFTENHPYIPFYDRHSVLIALSLISMVAFLTMIIHPAFTHNKIPHN